MKTIDLLDHCLQSLHYQHNLKSGSFRDPNIFDFDSPLVAAVNRDQLIEGAGPSLQQVLVPHLSLSSPSKTNERINSPPRISASIDFEDDEMSSGLVRHRPENTTPSMAPERCGLAGAGVSQLRPTPYPTTEPEKLRFSSFDDSGPTSTSSPMSRSNGSHGTRERSKSPPTVYSSDKVHFELQHENPTYIGRNTLSSYSHSSYTGRGQDAEYTVGAKDGDGDGDGDGWDKDRGPPRLGSTSGPGHVAVSPQHGAVVPSSFSSILEDVYPSDRYTVRSPSGVRSTPTSKPSGGVTNNASTLSVNSSRGVTAISGAPAGLPDRRSHVANSPESAAVPVSVIAGGKVLELERVQRYAGGAVALLYGGSLVSQSAWVSSCTVTSGVICRES